LHAGDTNYVVAAADALRRIAPTRPDIAAEVAQLLDSSDPRQRYEGAQALAWFGPQARGALPKLRHLMSEIDPTVSINAAISCSYIEGITKEQVATVSVTLQKALLARSSSTRPTEPAVILGIDWLKSAGPTAADARHDLIDILSVGEEDGYWHNVKNRAAWALMSLGLNDKQSVQALKEFVRTPYADRRLKTEFDKRLLQITPTPK
jgi:hypothetical protein